MRFSLLLWVVALLVFAGCEDDDSFSVSQSDRLWFTADTVKMDTLFSAVPSITKSFWVHNDNSKGLRCTSVRLERGNQSGFRVNVDGVYLSRDAGYQTGGVEIRKGDSLRVFVELTSPGNGKQTPQRVEDNLVFLLESGREQKVNLNAWSWDASKYTNLHIAKDTTLTGEKPIVVYGKLTVETGATLTLAAGTTLYFHHGAGIDVYGRLQCLGEPGNEVTLWGDRLDWMFDYLPYDLMSGLWAGVRFYEPSYDNVMAFTDLHIAKDTMLTGEKPIVVYGKLTVETGATLTLAAGTTLYFHHGAGIDVYGRLQCLGEPGNEVTLRGDRLDWMFDYLPYDLMSGLWAGVRFYEPSYDNVMAFTDLHSSFDGIVCDSADVNKQKLTLKNMTVHNCQGTGLGMSNCRVTAENCQFTNTLKACVDMTGGNVAMNFCTLAQFYPFDGNRGPALNFRSTTTMPLKLSCTNSIVTGYAEDVVMGSTEGEEDAFDYLFETCILRTPKVDDEVRMKDVVFEDVEDTASVQGEKHFKLVNVDTQHYDFRLSAKSTAIDKGNPAYPADNDRDGNKRGEKPDVGCFEFLSEE